MKNIWMLLIIFMMTGIVYAEGPVYNFNFGSARVDLGQTPILKKNAEEVPAKNELNFRRLGLELGIARVADGTIHDFGEAFLDLHGVNSVQLVFSYALNKNLALRLGYQEYFVESEETTFFSFQGKGGLLGIEYRSSGSKWFKFIAGFDFGYMYTGESYIGSSDVELDCVERIQFVTRFGPQLSLGRFFVNALLAVSYTKNNVNYNGGNAWSNEGELSTGFSASFGVMI